MTRVCLMRRAGRGNWEMQWKDPVTGLKVTRSTGTPLKRDAERIAARVEGEINSGDGFLEPSRLTWDGFVAQYQAEVLDGQSPGGRNKMLSVLRRFEKLINPAKLAVVGPQQVGEFARLMRADKTPETTIYSNLNCLRSALNWAFRQRLIRAKVHVEMPRKPPGMKGRPITAEEFDRLLAKAQDAGNETPDSQLLQGLWWSGLRLSEALALHWTDDRAFCVDMGGKRPMFFIRGHAEKGRKNRLLPMAPEFAELLQQTPTAAREGFVFLAGEDPRPSLWTVSRRLSAYGRAAKIRVTPDKFASAHDLRRAFGVRWAHRVMPPVLQELMRHESIATTMEYYVGRNAEVTADAAYAAHAQGLANTLANTARPTAPRKERKTA
jgi:integrase